MRDPITLRRAYADDLDFCQGHYEEAMRPAVERLFGWDQARQDESFRRQWAVEEVSIIASDGIDIGWMQVAQGDGILFLKQIHLARDFHNRRIGTRVLWGLLDQAKRRGIAVTLGVMKDNPARRLYDRLGFRPTHEDAHKVYLRRDPDA